MLGHRNTSCAVPKPMNDTLVKHKYCVIIITAKICYKLLKNKFKNGKIAYPVFKWKSC